MVGPWSVGIRGDVMLIDRLIQRLPCKSRLTRTLIGSVVAGLTVSVAVAVVFEVLGFGASAGIAAALGAVSAGAYAVARR
jgi:hypothetical protein